MADLLDGIEAAKAAMLTTSQGTDIVAEQTTPLEKALELVDTGLGDLMNRELVSTDEVSDLLLDVRQLVVAHQVSLEPVPTS
jgi:hypothetical protein